MSFSFNNWRLITVSAIIVAILIGFTLGLIYVSSSCKYFVSGIFLQEKKASIEKLIL